MLSLLMVLPWLASSPFLEPAAEDGDLAVLKAASVAVDGPGLLEFFRKRTHGELDSARLQQLVRQLGDDSFDLREKASAELVSLGALAASALTDAERDPDFEIADRARKSLALIKSGGSAEVASAAARVLARLNPPGTTEALLAYAPSAASVKTVQEIAKALTRTAAREHNIDREVAAALADKAAPRRQIAGEVLASAGDRQQRAAAAKLLKDRDVHVRLAVGLALAQAGDPEAISPLIDLVEELPTEQSWPVLDLLTRLAGEDQAPLVVLTDQESRRKSRQAWTKWWEARRSTMDLARLRRPPGQGYTAILLLEAGRALELDASGKIRWQISGLQKPLDLQVLPGKEEHVLVAEHLADRVTERNTKGKVVWEKAVHSPVMAQRLPNGNTFVASLHQLVEFDRQGKSVFSYNAQGGDDVMRARRLRNGDIALIIHPNTAPEAACRYVRMDASATKELASFPVTVKTQGGQLDVLCDGRVVVPQMPDNKVVEYDAEGKPIWELTVDQPIAATRLPDGHTLVTSMSQDRAIEFDRDGKEVWQYQSNTKVSRAFRR
jgi:HEAT repeat protein